MYNLTLHVSKFLQALAESLDISETNYLQAKTSYESIGNWLCRDESKLANYDPLVYPQGSIALGTVVKPISEEEEYDIDLVSEVLLSKNSVSQEQLKQLLGKEIRGYADAHGMKEPVTEGKRCWTLNYAAGARFHADILPAIPDRDSFKRLLESKGFSPDELSDLAIAITDKTHPNFSQLSPNWPVSNPRGYLRWFKNRMLIRLNEAKERVAKELGVHDVPEYKVKTPLQYSIQLLKRHRDLLFPNNDDKPISIIITTLAAHAYQNEEDVTAALVNIILGMPRFIRTNGSTIWIPNPVNPAENFADKWPHHPQRQKLFYDWLKQVESGFLPELRSGNLNSVTESCKKFIGESAVAKALDQVGTPKLYSIGRSSSNGRFNVDYKQEPYWPLQLDQRVSIRAQIKRNAYWQHFESGCAPLPKGCSLQFTAETNVPCPYSVHWQVVNTGEEATRRGQLRGDIFASTNASNRLKRDESTSYTGSHWIECFIVKDGICRARSGEYVVNIE